MIVSETPNRVKLRAWQACVLLCVAVPLPVGMTFALDYEAVEKRLGKAVAEGEFDLEQARVMMETLRRSDHHTPTAAHMREGVEHRINKIKKLVERGEMSREDGARLIEETHRALEDASDHDAAAHKRRYAEIERKIKTAVREGELSREEAEEKLIAVRKNIFGDRSQNEVLDARKKRCAEIERKIDTAVQAGKLSLEDAEKKLIAARKKIFQD